MNGVFAQSGAAKNLVHNPKSEVFHKLNLTLNTNFAIETARIKMIR